MEGEADGRWTRPTPPPLTQSCHSASRYSNGDAVAKRECLKLMPIANGGLELLNCSTSSASWNPPVQSRDRLQASLDLASHDGTQNFIKSLPRPRRWA